MRILQKVSSLGAALVFGLMFAGATTFAKADGTNTSSSTASGTAASNGFTFAYVDQDGSVYVKTGATYGSYTKVWDSSDPATNVEVSHNAIAVLDQAGNVFVMNALPQFSNWTKVTSGVTTRNFGISDTNVYLFLNNTLYSKPINNLSYGWGQIFSNVQGFDVSASGNLVAETTDNTLYEAYGGVGAQWTAVATNFSDYSVANNEIAAVFNHQAYVMIGAPVNNAWRPVYSNATFVQLSAKGIIAVTDQSGNLDVAPGGYGSQWVNNVRSASDSEYTYVADGAITALHGGTVFAKTTINGVWSQLAGTGGVLDYSVE